MKTEVKHTPTPWIMKNYCGAVVTEIIAKDDHSAIAKVYGTDGEAKATAACIVRSINAHDDLVAALRSARALLAANRCIGARSTFERIEKALDLAGQ